MMMQPTNVAVVIGLWAAAAVFGSAGPVAYVAMGQLFPPEQTGRVSTAVNMLSLGGAFLVQAAIGWILDLWPRTPAGGWDPDGYSWALGLTTGLQAVAAVVLATAPNQTNRA
jgi:MFS family permease